VLDPGVSFTFNDNGVARPLDFGTFRAAAGVNRTNVIGSSDARRLVDQGTQSRLPDSEILRLQSGFTFDLASRAELFAEAKFIREETVTGPINRPSSTAPR
jgi:hypothetical protein